MTVANYNTMRENLVFCMIPVLSILNCFIYVDFLLIAQGFLTLLSI